MSAFEHITTLLSFVFALALTHILASATDMLLKRDRVRFSWLQAIWMVNAMILLLNNWLAVWDDHGLQHWDVLSVSLQFTFTVLQYFTCSLVSPSVPEEGVLDMWQFSQRQRRYYLSAIAALGVFAAGTNTYFSWKRGGDYLATLAAQILLVPMTAIVVFAIFVRRPRLQLALALAFGFGMAASMIAFTNL